MSKVALNPINKSHVKKTYEWIRDPDFRKKFLIRGETSWKRHKEYFNNLIDDKSQAAYAILLEDSHVGNCGFKYININDRSSEIWLYIGETGFRGLGLGGLALDLLLEKGENELSLMSMFVHVSEKNIAAQNLYKNRGFKTEGEISQEWQNREENMIRLLWRVA